MRVTRTTRVMNEQYQRYCQDESSGAAHLERPYAKPQVTTRRYRDDGERFVPR